MWHLIIKETKVPIDDDNIIHGLQNLAKYILCWCPILESENIKKGVRKNMHMDITLQKGSQLKILAFYLQSQEPIVKKNEVSSFSTDGKTVGTGRT